LSEIPIQFSVVPPKNENVETHARFPNSDALNSQLIHQARWHARNYSGRDRPYALSFLLGNPPITVQASLLKVGIPLVKINIFKRFKYRFKNENETWAVIRVFPKKIAKCIRPIITAKDYL